MKPEELNEILADHAKWLRGEGGQQANLSLADLRCANLREANLVDADLSVANLIGADLRWADLRGADLSGANLSGADLRWADLRGANLSGANLSGANLSGANLSEANLSMANLSGANLSVAILMLANLSKARIDTPICRVDFGGWSICVYADRTSIGCQTYPNECWLAWEPDSPEIVRMHTEASAWWATHGEVVKAAIRCVMAKAKGGDA